MYIYVGPFGMPEEDARLQYGDQVVDAAIGGETVTLDDEAVTAEPAEEYQPGDNKTLSW